MSQWYEYVPGLVNVTAYDVLGVRLPESHACASDLSAVVVCAVESLLVQVTVVPGAHVQG